MKQTCQLCGGKLSPRWNPGDPMRCQACGAGNRRLEVIEDRGSELAHDYYVEERIATGRDIWSGEWYDDETALD